MVKIVSRQEAAMRVANLGLKYAHMLGINSDTDRIRRWTALQKSILQGDEQTIKWCLSKEALKEFDAEMNQVSI
ncbi:MAG TPA: hypothetical protein PKH07_18490 [bacterium]|nr:hypothetical protein [bacterium]